jgi:hypothetical protein
MESEAKSTENLTQKGEGKMKKYEYQFWQHRSSGEVYAVRLVEGKVVSAVGPLYYEEAQNTPLDAYEYLDYDAIDGGTWVEENRDEFQLAYSPDA